MAISYKSDQGAFFKLITEEGPSDLRDEISLPDEVVDMAWQGTNHHQEKEEDIFPKLPDIEKFNIYETLDYVFEANLSFLVLTLDNNTVLSYLYGAVPFIKWDGNKVCSDDEKLVTARFTDDLNQIFVISKCQNQYKCHKIDTSQEYSIESNLKSLFDYSQNTLITQSIVSYLEICLKEMNKKWDQSVYGSWHNYQNELILMFLWGIQTPDLVSFLTPINDVKAFNDVTQKCINICNQIQRYSIINYTQATDLLFHNITKLEVSGSFEFLKPRHEQTDFSKIQHYIGQMALKNVELAQIINASLEKGSSFFLWIYSVLTRIHGVEIFDITDDINEQSDADQHKILKFIQAYINPKRISQYFEQKPLEFPFHDADSEINFQNILRKHQVQSDFIYDNSWIDDATSIAKLSLKTTLDYTRRLITKLCFRDETGNFGIPMNKLSMSLQIQQTISLANDFDNLGPNTKYAYYIDYINNKTSTPALTFATVNDGKVILSTESDSKLVEREYGSSQTKVLEIHHFEDNRFFVLMEKNEKQIIGVVQFNKEMEIIDKHHLEESFTEICPSLERGICCLQTDSSKKIVLYELVNDDEDEC